MMTLDILSSSVQGGCMFEGAVCMKPSGRCDTLLDPRGSNELSSPTRVLK